MDKKNNIIIAFLIILIIVAAILGWYYFKKQSQNFTGFKPTNISDTLSKQRIVAPVTLPTTLKGVISSADGQTGQLIIGQSVYVVPVIHGKFSLNLVIPGVYPAIFVDSSNIVHKLNPGQLQIYQGENNYNLTLQD